MPKARNQIISGRAPEPVGPYVHARRVGNLLFLAGMGPRKKGSQEIPGVTLDSQGDILSYDFEIQCRSVFENIKVVLEEAGVHWNDIVDVTAFLIDLKSDFKTFNRIYAEYFSENLPTRTTIEVSRLPTPIAIEVKAIAAIHEKD